MSKSQSLVKKLDPVGDKYISKVGGGVLDPIDLYGHQAESMDAAAKDLAAKLAGGAVDKRSADKQVEARRDQRGATAAATSTAALDSDYFLLGTGGPKTRAKGAYRQLLGE